MWQFNALNTYFPLLWYYSEKWFLSKAFYVHISSRHIWWTQMDYVTNGFDTSGRSNLICSSIREHCVAMCQRKPFFFLFIILSIQRVNIHFRQSLGFVHFCYSMALGNVHTPIHHTIWFWLIWKIFCIRFAFGFGIWIYWNIRGIFLNIQSLEIVTEYVASGTKLKGFVWLRVNGK